MSEQTREEQMRAAVQTFVQREYRTKERLTVRRETGTANKSGCFQAYTWVSKADALSSFGRMVWTDGETCRFVGDDA